MTLLVLIELMVIKLTKPIAGFNYKRVGSVSNSQLLPTI